MANGDIVAAAATVIRYVKPAQIQEGRVTASTFDRLPDEDGVSVSRLGVLQPADRDADLVQLRALLNDQRELKVKGRLAEFRVADIEAAGAMAKRTVRVIEDATEAVGGKPGNPAHALIDGLPFMGAPSLSLEDMAIGDMIGQCVLHLHPAK